MGDCVGCVSCDVLLAHCRDFPRKGPLFEPTRSSRELRKTESQVRLEALSLGGHSGFWLRSQVVGYMYDHMSSAGEHCQMASGYARTGPARSLSLSLSLSFFSFGRDMSRGVNSAACAPSGAPDMCGGRISLSLSLSLSLALSLSNCSSLRPISDLTLFAWQAPKGDHMETRALHDLPSQNLRNIRTFGRKASQARDAHDWAIAIGGPSNFEVLTSCDMT